MIRLAALVGREIRQRARFFLAALAIGTIPLVLPLLPSLRGARPEEIRDALALNLALFFLLATLAILGSGMLVRDWAEGRMGFYLARPFHAWQIWIGNLLATSLLALGGSFLVLVPSLLLGYRPWQSPLLPFDLELDPFTHLIITQWRADTSGQFGLWMYSEAWYLVPFLYLAPFLIPLTVLLVAYLLGVLGRLRGPETLLDLLLLGSSALFASAAFWRAIPAGGSHYARAGALLTAGLFVALLAFSGWVQLRLAGSQARTAHRTFTRMLAAGLLILVGGYSLGSHSVATASPGSLDQITHLEPAPQGDWLAMAGRTAPWGSYPAFAAHVPSGRFYRLSSLDTIGTRPTFSHNGNRLAWIACVESSPQGGKGCELHWLDFGDGLGARQAPIPDGLPAENLGNRGLALEDSGERVAIYDALHRISLYNLDDGKLLERWQMPARSFFGSLDFLADGRLFCQQWNNDQALTTFTFELVAGQEPIPGSEISGLLLRSDPRLDRGLVQRPAEVIELVRLDGTSLASVDAWGASILDLRILPDGNGLAALRRSSRVELVHLKADGSSRRLLGSTGSLLLGDLIAPGMLLLGQRESQGFSWSSKSLLEQRFGPADEWTSLILDLERGEIVRQLPGWIPLLGGGRRMGSLGSKDADPKAWLLDRQGQPYRLEVVASEAGGAATDRADTQSGVGLSTEPIPILADIRWSEGPDGAPKR